VLDRRSKTWNYFFWEDHRRRSKRIGTLKELPTKSAARAAAEQTRAELAKPKLVQPVVTVPTVAVLVDKYRTEKMKQRLSTRRAYDAWLNNHIIPKWGEHVITDLQPRDVELWVESLLLSPKSRVHIRGLIGILWDYAMWAKLIPIQRNPMELVTIKDATSHKKPRSLTEQEFQELVKHLAGPFRVIALLGVCLGLRISEILALKWGDVDWLEGKLTVERGIVRQHTDETKTKTSNRKVPLDNFLLDVLKIWKQTTQFSEIGDWIFASPIQHGKLPWSYPNVWLKFQVAAEAAGLGRLGTHSMRHTYRSWLDAVGTTVAVQQKLMRHSDVRTTMNDYGDVVTDEMAQANSKIAAKALNGR
jgi:integrase